MTVLRFARQQHSLLHHDRGNRVIASGMSEQIGGHVRSDREVNRVEFFDRPRLIWQ